MKICLISNLYPPTVMGGAELYVEKIANKLAEDKNNQIIVITANQKFSWQLEIEEKNNIRIYKIWPLNFYSLTTKKKYSTFLKMLWHLFDVWNIFSYFTVKKILRKENPEIVHTHNLAGLSFSVFDAIKSQKIKTIHTCHDYYLLCPYANLICPLTNWRFKKIPPFFCRWYRQTTRRVLKNKIDVVLTPSKFVMETHLKNGFFKNSKQVVLPLGINSINSQDAGNQSNKLFNILCVSQLAQHKGVDILLKAFKSLSSANCSKLEIVGTGTERKNLEKLAEGNENIKFLGQLSYQEVQKKYQDVSLVVIPSLAPETFSLVMFEAMANGKLIIASKIGALDEYIKNHETGLLFETGSINNLKETLEKVINSPDLIKKIGQNAKEFAQEFTFEKHWKKLEEIYKN